MCLAHRWTCSLIRSYLKKYGDFRDRLQLIRDTQVDLKPTYAVHRKNTSRVTSNLDLMEGEEVSRLTRPNLYHSFSA